MYNTIHQLEVYNSTVLIKFRVVQPSPTIDFGISWPKKETSHLSAVIAHSTLYPFLQKLSVSLDLPFWTFHINGILQQEGC